MKKKLLILATTIFYMVFSNLSFANSYIMHTVTLNDSYWNICETYGKDINDLMSLNNFPDNNLPLNTLFKIQQIPSINIFINGEKVYTDSDSYLEKNYAHIPIRSIANAINADEIVWDQASMTAIVSKNGTIIKLPLHSKTAYINDTPFSLKTPINIINGRIYAPLRFISEAFNYSVSWEQETSSIYVGTQNLMMKATIPSNSINYSEEDLYWLSRIVEAESSGEPYNGKLAVANIIINRKNSSLFPNTIKDVIFDRYQFTPVKIGTIYNTPSQESINAAKDALSGNNNIGDCLYFLNPLKSTNFWIMETKTYFVSINDHDFYY